MPPVIIDNPILNSPFLEPSRHFRFTSVVLVVAVIARLASLIVSLTTDFWRSIEVVPSNWRKICLSVDVLRPIEILPGQIGYPPNEETANEIKQMQLRQSPLFASGGAVGIIIALFFRSDSFHRKQ